MSELACQASTLIVEARYYKRVGLPSIHTHSRGALL